MNTRDSHLTVAPEEQAQQREATIRQNRELIEESGIPFTISGDGMSALFRESGKRKVDFFFATGSWKCHQPKWLGSGGVEKFLAWYSEKA